MSSAPSVRRWGAPRPGADSAGTDALLVPLGLILAMALPFFVVSTRSDDLHNEAKTFAQAAAAALALTGLLFARPGEPAPRRTGLLGLSGLALGSALLLGAMSAIANHATFDPFVSLAVLSPAALFVAGASSAAYRAQGRILGIVGACGAATGALAFGQRYLDLPRLPVETPQSRFLATALVGNPGEMAAALVVPALLLWGPALDRTRRPRPRILSAIGFLACALGLGAAEAVTPIVALLTGLGIHTLLAPRRRLPPLALALLVGTGVLAVTGAGVRLARKLDELRTGRFESALTQRDIGLAAGAEMVARAPILGVGPGGYESAFVPARAAAEARHRHRFVHLSESAHFENAHCEPVTLAADVGLPAALLGLLAFVLLAVALLRKSTGEMRDLLAPALLAFFVLSLGSFPLRMSVAVGPFALVAGLGWRSAGGGFPLPSGPNARRGLLAAGSLLALLLGGARLLCAVRQTRGETALRQAAISASRKGDLLAQARADLTAAVRLRPRSPSAWLALGSCERLDGNVDRAWDYTGRSFALEERAETDFNLGRIAFDEWDRVTAHALFVRAVWLLPRLADSLGESYAPGAVELDVADAERHLAATGEVPPLPARVEVLRLKPRFP